MLTRQLTFPQIQLQAASLSPPWLLTGPIELNQPLKFSVHCITGGGYFNQGGRTSAAWWQIKKWGSEEISLAEEYMALPNSSRGWIYGPVSKFGFVKYLFMLWKFH